MEQAPSSQAVASPRTPRRSDQNSSPLNNLEHGNPYTVLILAGVSTRSNHAAEHQGYWFATLTNL